jgi:Domain of unknown function (DUF4157)/Regulator of G protein signaling domain
MAKMRSQVEKNQALPISRSQLMPIRGFAPIQPKLTIGEPGDKYEQEADQVAAQVVNQIHAPAAQKAVQRQNMSEEDELQMKPMDIQRQDAMEEEELQMKPINTIQRQDAMEEDELQMKPMDTIQRQDAIEEEELQMKPAVQRQSEAEEATPDLESSIQQARGGGQAMPNLLKAKMEQSFGADFSGVKVHTDSRSNQLNQAIQAKAFTTGKDIFFRQGAYDPSSRGGQELLAHELTHVVQQGGSAVQPKRMMQRQIEQNAIGRSDSNVIQRLFGKKKQSTSPISLTPEDFFPVLNNQTARRYLREYCLKNSNSENIFFLDAVDLYKQGHMQANTIYQAFIRDEAPTKEVPNPPKAPKIINIDAPIRKNIEKSIKQPNDTAFDDAYQAIRRDIYRDIFPRFIKDPLAYKASEHMHHGLGSLEGADMYSGLD